MVSVRAMAKRGRTGAGRGVALAAAAALVALGGAAAPASAASAVKSNDAKTTTPIKHVVVIFGENESFDHYFATYPKAANTDGTTFVASPKTPKVNNLANAKLLTKNPNQYLPKRLSPSQALTCSQNHSYGP